MARSELGVSFRLTLDYDSGHLSERGFGGIEGIGGWIAAWTGTLGRAAGRITGARGGASSGGPEEAQETFFCLCKG